MCFKYLERKQLTDILIGGYGSSVQYLSKLFNHVAANHENDTCFENGLVMGSADYMYYAGLVKHQEGCFKCKIGPLSDTLQADACLFLPFQNHVITWSKSTTAIKQKITITVNCSKFRVVQLTMNVI